jgi:hydantoinase/carbamoylase family amidase
LSQEDAPAIDAASVIADLRELAHLTSDEGGAQRVCWTQGWRDARAFLISRLDDLGLGHEIDEAGNLWARIGGADSSAPALALGSHVDSVPAGGWLDGALGVMGALGVLRSWTGSGRTPPRDLVLIDFADEEGSRFGRSLFGSSALAGTLDPEAVANLRDAAGEAVGDALAANGVDLATAPRAHDRLASIGAWLELHIEQGPVLEAEGSSCSAVSGCAGVERHLLTFSGQASHAGTTPMDARRDAGLAAAEAALAIERIAIEHGGVGTTGRLEMRPGVVTAVAGRAELSVDLRHAEAEPLADMISAALMRAATIADERRCVFGGEPTWRIDPVPFDEGLVTAAAAACEARGGRGAPIASGALHDAAELARRIPTAMIFCASRGGISHAKEEDSSVEDLLVAIEAFGDLAGRAI